MKLFDVYPLFDINIVKGKGCHVWDENGTEYLDLYGGHAVISISTSTSTAAMPSSPSATPIRTTWR